MRIGILPSALADIFSKRDELVREGVGVSIEMSYIEIYMEDCFDLLAKDSTERMKLDLRETHTGILICFSRQQLLFSQRLLWLINCSALRFS
jgi:hypothetical protein